MRACLGAMLVTALAGLGCRGTTPAPQSAPASDSAGSAPGPGRGIPDTSTWASFYGTAKQMGDLARAARTFRVFDIDADPGDAPGAEAFSDADLQVLRAGGQNRVLSYLNLGSCERTRSYWDRVPEGFVSCGANTKAHRGAYAGYPDETWMDLGDADYRHLLVDFVAKRLALRGVDGFYLDNLEMVEHGTDTANGPCDAACSQGGLDLVRALREAFPNHLIVMQNATGDRTRTGATGGLPFPGLLDGVAHESVYFPEHDADAEAELHAWKALALTPGGRPFFLATDEYVGGCTNTDDARAAYAKSRAAGFTPFATDASEGQNVLCYWE